MTIAIVINVVLSAAILATIIGMKLWAIGTQHHDRLGAADHRVAIEHAPRANRSRSADARRRAGGRVHGPSSAIE